MFNGINILALEKMWLNCCGSQTFSLVQVLHCGAFLFIRYFTCYAICFFHSYYTIDWNFNDYNGNNNANSYWMRRWWRQRWLDVFLTTATRQFRRIIFTVCFDHVCPVTKLIFSSSMKYLHFIFVDSKKKLVWKRDYKINL